MTFAIFIFPPPPYQAWLSIDQLEKAIEIITLYIYLARCLDVLDERILSCVDLYSVNIIETINAVFFQEIRHSGSNSFCNSAGISTAGFPVIPAIETYSGSIEMFIPQSDNRLNWIKFFD